MGRTTVVQWTNRQTATPAGGVIRSVAEFPALEWTLEENMKLSKVTACLLLVMLAVGVTYGEERRHGAGFGFTSGLADGDFVDEIEFVGFTAFGKIGFTDNWGLLISIRAMEDDETLAFGEEDEYTQVAVHAVYMWRHGKRVRPHVKFGLAKTDFEAKVLGFTLSDEDTNVSVGGGLEAGSDKVAFFADFDYTEAEFFGLDIEYSNLTLGVMFKF